MIPEIVTSLPLLGLTAVLAYLLGSVPFGLVIARAVGLGDLREIGSGNIGATNVLRTGSKPAALATLLLDSGKGAIAVLLARGFVGEDAAQLAGLAAFLGHLFPIWLGFKGGKGVATYLGTLLALFFPVGAAACLTWLVVAALMRISSLSALVTALLVPLWLIALGRPDMVLLAFALGALIWNRHTGNIRRILDGTEAKIGRKVDLMGFREAIRTCLSKYFTFSGRAGRAEFWWFFLFYNLVVLAGFVLVIATVSENGEGGTLWPMLVATLFLLPPMIAVTGRRLHDKGLTAWVILIMIVPFGSLALLIICALPGEAENNAHGPALWSPPPEPAYTKSNIPNVKERDEDQG